MANENGKNSGEQNPSLKDDLIEQYMLSLPKILSGTALDQAEESLKEAAIELKDSGIPEARKILAAKFALLSVLIGGYKHGLSGAVNAGFSEALGYIVTGITGSEVAGGAFAGVSEDFLNYLSKEAHENNWGGFFYDVLHSKQFDDPRTLAAFGKGIDAAIAKVPAGASKSAPREIKDSSGKLLGYFVASHDAGSQTMTETVLNPDGSVARQLVFDHNTLSTSGNGIVLTKNYETGETTATIRGDHTPMFVGPNGEVGLSFYFGTQAFQIKLSSNALGGGAITSIASGKTVNFSATATLSRQGDLVVIKQEKAPGSAPLLTFIRADGKGYTVTYNAFTKQEIATPLDGGGADFSSVRAWILKSGGQSAVDDVDSMAESVSNAASSSKNASFVFRGRSVNAGVKNLNAKTTVNQDGFSVAKSIGSHGNAKQAMLVPSRGGVSPIHSDTSGAAGQADMQAGISTGGSSEMLLSKAAENPHSAGGAIASASKLGSLSFNSDGSGSTTTTNSDGTRITTPFNSMVGAVKLADIFGTLPEVVGANIGKFALHYTAMANQYTPLPQGQVAAGGLAADPDVKGASSNPGSDIGTQAADVASAAEGSGGPTSDASGVVSGAAGAAAAAAGKSVQENQDAGIQPQDKAGAEEAMA